MKRFLSLSIRFEDAKKRVVIYSLSFLSVFLTQCQDYSDKLPYMKQFRTASSESDVSETDYDHKNHAELILPKKDIQKFLLEQQQEFQCVIMRQSSEEEVLDVNPLYGNLTGNTIHHGTSYLQIQLFEKFYQGECYNLIGYAFIGKTKEYPHIQASYRQRKPLGCIYYQEQNHIDEFDCEGWYVFTFLRDYPTKKSFNGFSGIFMEDMYAIHTKWASNE